MVEQKRLRAALLFSVLLHSTVFLLDGLFIDAFPKPVAQLVEVELIDAPMLPVVSPEKRAVLAQGGASSLSATTAVGQERSSASAWQGADAARLAPVNPQGNGHSVSGDVSSAAGTGDGAGGFGNRSGNGAGGGDLDGTAASAPQPGSMGYSEVAILRRVNPVYPQREAARGGRVLVRVMVTAQGVGESCVVEQSSNNPALDQAALYAARQCRFVPARDLATGEAVAKSVVIPFDFTPIVAPEEEEELW